MPLNFAKQDVLSLYNELKSLSGGPLTFDGDTQGVKVDQDATPRAILQSAETIVARTRAGDTAVVFFSGHGLRGADGRFYMAMSATRAGDIAGTSLAWDDLSAVLAKTEGRLLVLLDGCHPSAAGSALFARNDAAALGIKSQIPSGIVVLSASKGYEASSESSAMDTDEALA